MIFVSPNEHEISFLPPVFQSRFTRLGDAWAAYLAFELVEGSDAKRKDVLQRCVNAEPNYGVQWNRVVKRPDHWKLTYPEKLRVVVEEYYPQCLVATAQKTPIGQGK